MAHQWYIARDRKKYGPYSLAQMTQMAGAGQLFPTDMVLQEGTTKWLAAAQVQTFFPAPGTAPPPPLPPPVAPQPEAQGNVSLFAKIKETFGKLTDLVKIIQEGYSWAVKLVAVLTVVLPPIFDFLRPIGPFNFLIFLFFSLVALLLLVLFVKRPRTLNYGLGGICAFSIVVALGFGAWWGLALVTSSTNRGFLGSHVAFVERFQDAVVTSKSVEGEKLAEEVRKHMEQEKDARKLLQFAFEGYPGNVIKAEVIGDPKRKPGADGVYQYNLRLSVDVEQYETITKKRILPVLEKVGLKKGEEFATSEPSQEGFNIIAPFNVKPLQMSKLGFLGPRKMIGMELEGKEIEGKWMPNPEDDEMLIVVNTARSGSDDRTTWKLYRVPKAPVVRFSTGEIVAVDIVFQGKKQQELMREHLTLTSALGSAYPRKSVPALMTELRYDNKPVRFALLSTYIVSTNFRGETVYSPSVTVEMEIRLTSSELQQLGSIRCSVKNCGGGE